MWRYEDIIEPFLISGTGIILHIVVYLWELKLEKMRRGTQSALCWMHMAVIIL
jgi:hypothetical protein